MAEESKENQSTDTASPLAGFAGLSDSDFIEVATEDKKEPIVEEVVPPIVDKKEEPVIPKEEKVIDKPKDEPELGDGDDKDGFENPGEEVETAETEVEAKWIDVAKEIGFEIKDDSYESFVEGKKTFIENIKTETLKDVEVKAFKEQIAELPAESQLLVLGLKEGLTREQIEAPFKLIESYKALSDVDLIAKDLELQGMPEDVVANEIEKMVENDKVDVEAKRLRILLDNEEKNLLGNKLKEVKELVTENENIFKEKLAKESEEIIKHINMIDMFMDTKVSKKNKEYLAKKWESGAYHELAKDPAKIAKFMLWDEFGEKGINNLKSNLTSKFVEEKARKQHNVPPIIQSGSSSNSGEGAKDPVGNFEVFSHLNEM